jgi:hypothetical protein
MGTLDLKKIVPISFAGHIAVFAILASMRFSLCQVPRHAPFTPIIYCASLSSQPLFGPAALRPYVFAARGEPSLAPFSPPAEPVVSDFYVKPATAVSYVSVREPVKSPLVLADPPKRKDSVLMLHPLLPYQFNLYFRDRQTVHIELEFEITQADMRNFVSLRRKISSGNLEADLLSMRYIGHYLFIQQARFMPAKWQTVKIEFSPNTGDDSH